MNNQKRGQRPRDEQKEHTSAPAKDPTPAAPPKFFPFWVKPSTSPAVQGPMSAPRNPQKQVKAGPLADHIHSAARPNSATAPSRLVRLSVVVRLCLSEGLGADVAAAFRPLAADPVLFPWPTSSLSVEPAELLSSSLDDPWKSPLNDSHGGGKG